MTPDEFKALRIQCAARLNQALEGVEHHKRTSNVRWHLVERVFDAVLSVGHLLIGTAEVIAKAESDRRAQMSNILGVRTSLRTLVWDLTQDPDLPESPLVPELKRIDEQLTLLLEEP